MWRFSAAWLALLTFYSLTTPSPSLWRYTALTSTTSWRTSTMMPATFLLPPLCFYLRW